MINSTSSTERTVPAAPLAAATPSAPRPPVQRPDQISTDSAEHLRTSLASQPEVRPEVVERAKALAADANYPSAAILHKIAGMIVNSPDLSEVES